VTAESLAQPVVIGVDTHDLVHVAVAVDRLGHRCGDTAIQTTPAGYEGFVSWALEFGTVAAVAMEGTGSYGSGLCALLQQRGVRVVEVVRPSRQQRRNRGKSDLLDAEAAARAFLGGEATAQPRGADAAIAMIRSLRVAREAMVTQRTQTINQLRALIVTAPPDLRQSLAPLSAPRLIQRVARFRIDGLVSPADASRFVLRQLGRHVRAIDVQIGELNDTLTPLVANRAPELLALRGVGVEVAGNLLVAWDNAARIRSEAAFAALCGVAPIPASSGKTSRHRLSRGGDRSANRALWRIVLTRLRTDDRTREYLARRRAEGKSHREVVRCLKRYVAREVFHVLQRLVPTFSALDAT
jgi:transposase